MNTVKYTFKDLFGSKFKFDKTEISLNKIEIPIIQRDYAQGRKNNEVGRIRDRFLDALINAINNKKPITLDFIYGDISLEGVLTPLDGQQRLTTLFLLHWYLAKKEEREINEYNFLGNFSYSTRFSSRDFCQELVKFSPVFTNGQLSKAISDQSWYPYEWKNDPTIQSMLVMIDAIHEKFKNTNNLWESLVIDRNISFYFLPLNEMGLTDDLYIKMNSRGKPLTQFEHFKAEFEEIIKQQSAELSKEINNKFDIGWTDMLFPFRGKDNIIDDKFMRYFHFISDIICYKSGLDFERDEFKLAKLLYSNNNEKVLENIKYFKASFDCWCNLDILVFFNSFFSQNKYESGQVKLYQDDLNIFKECIDNYGEYYGRNRKFPLNKILLLYSIITYLQNTEKVSEKDFRKRIRILRNLIWNSADEIREERMKTLLSETETITMTGEIPITGKGDLGFNVRQKDEERNKIGWLIQNPQLEDELFDLEDHTLLKGCIAVVNLNNSHNFKKFRFLFDNCSKDLINRALLSIGEYSQSISWRYQIGAKSNDSVWFDLFHPTKQRQCFDKTVEVINTLLDNIEESEINNQFLEQLINKYLADKGTPYDWRYYLVKYSSMREGNFGMYYWENRDKKPYEIIMMNTEKSIGGRNWDISLYTLSAFPEFSKKLSIGDYAYQGDKLKIINTDIEIDCLNDKFVTTQNEEQMEYQINQVKGIDTEDRIDKGKQIIRDILNDLTKK